MFPPTKFVWDKFYSGWMNFYNRTNSVLSPMEQCDCYRSGDKVQIKGSKIGSTTLENRYFYDSEHDNLVIYLQKFGLLPFKAFHNSSNIDFTPKRLHSKYPGETVIGQWEDAIHLLGSLTIKPKFILINSGLWNNGSLNSKT